jgi:hypothetical protein
MASHPDEIRGHTTCAVDVSPEVVDAGAEMTLTVKVSCSPACDLRGHTVSIKDQAGAGIASLELTTFDGTTNQTLEFAARAPVAAGHHTWSIASAAVVKAGVSYEEASTTISFTVKPHTSNVVVWDIPSTNVVGETFRLKVGIRCSKECRLANRHFRIYDHEGAHVATGTLSADVWPGTTALYFADVEVEAPATEGLYTWTVNGPSTALAPGPGSDGEMPHAESAASFGVRVVNPPEYVVTVETIDVEHQMPLSGARVVMHPYNAVTDERGIAEVRVAKGAYKLFVSQTRYVTFGLPVDVDRDMRARAELYLEPVQERN